jgi:hypothetical protein
MKKVRLITLMLSLLAATVSADESSVPLSQQTLQRVQQQTREMSALGIPESQEQEMLTRMVQNRFQEQNRTRARQIVMDAAKAGLPTEPVMSKAMEGMAKQVEEQQVIRAMETVRSRYAYANRLAKTLSDEKTTIDTLTHSIADSMAAGMKSRDMDAMMQQLQTQRRQQKPTRSQAETDLLAIQTVQTIRTMARRGYDSSKVASAVGQALQSQYSHQEMKQLRARIAKQAHQELGRLVTGQHAGSIGKGSNSGNAGGSGSGGATGGSGGGGGSGSGGSGGSGGGGGSGGSGGSGGGGAGGPGGAK